MTNKEKSNIVLNVGDILPFNVYDGKGNLVARKGHKVTDDRQRVRLAALVNKKSRLNNNMDTTRHIDNTPVSLIEMIERELREAMTNKNYEKENKTIDKPILNDNPYETIVLLQTRLANAYKTFIKDRSFKNNILDICEKLQEACQTDEDVSIASIMLTKETIYSIRHPIHTAIVCEIVGKYIGWIKDKRLPVLAAALTMNISMWKLQDQLLNQIKPLSKGQQNEIYSHPEKSTQLLMNIGVTDRNWLDCIMEHHESLDGKGYPLGLKEKGISQGARLLACADVYCAQITPRKYKPIMQPSNTMKNLFSGKGRVFDNEISLALVKILGMFPPGIFVRLKNGEVAIVTQRGEKVHWPIVHVVFKANRDIAMGIVKRDTSNSEYSIVEEIPVDETIEIDPNKYWGYSVYGRQKSHKRKHSRINTHINAKIFDYDRNITADVIVTNLSIGGCLLKVGADFGRFMEINTSFLLIFSMVEGFFEKLSITIKNFAEATNYALIGCQFSNITEENRKTIGDYLKALQKKSN